MSWCIGQITQQVSPHLRGWYKDGYIICWIDVILSNFILKPFLIPMMAKLCDVKMIRPQQVIYVPPYKFEMLCTIVFV